MAQALNGSESQESQISTIPTLPSLADAEVSPVSITATYLDVDELEKGWSIRCFYGGISERDHEVVDQASGEVEIKKLKSVMMITESEDGGMITYESAAAVLVSTLEEKEKQGLLTLYKSGFQLTFLGKKKNKTNSFSSARWDVRMLNFN